MSRGRAIALFVVTVFWGFVADLYRNRQGRRVFGIIAMGSSLGGIAGSSVTAVMADRIPVFFLLLVSVIPLEVAGLVAAPELHGGGKQSPAGRSRPGPWNGTVRDPDGLP